LLILPPSPAIYLLLFIADILAKTQPQTNVNSHRLVYIIFQTYIQAGVAVGALKGIELPDSLRIRISGVFLR
jgi:hypothetical protein